MTFGRKCRTDSGFISVELMVAVAFSFIFLVFLLNLVFVQYGRGVIRAAADEGARAGSRVDASELVCTERANNVLTSLGGMAKNPQVVCTIDAETQRITATVDATFEPWMFMVPEIQGHGVGTSVKEQAPE